MNNRLHIAYLLKEQFDLVWSYRTEQGLFRPLWIWRQMLKWTRLAPLIRCRAILYRHLAGVLALTKHRLSNAALAGDNRRVRGLSHRARGYRSPQNLMVALYHASWA